MNWRKGDDYFIRSECGNYTITRLYDSRGEKFEVWRRRMHVSTHDDAQAARDAAEAHSILFDAGAPAGTAYAL